MFSILSLNALFTCLAMVSDDDSASAETVVQMMLALMPEIVKVSGHKKPYSQ